MLRRFPRGLVTVVGCLLAGWTPTAEACPFCRPVSRTLSEEMDAMDAVVIGRLTKPLTAADKGKDPTPVTFEIAEIIKGKSFLGKTKTVETVYGTGAKRGDRFLVLGVDPPSIAWSTPLKLSDRAVDYVRRIRALPQSPERLAFFQDFLEDQEGVLARDAYDEFAKAPYKDVKAVKDRMNHDQIVAWIKTPGIPASRRRLYLVMLSVCGGPGDLPMLEDLLKSEDRKIKVGLDAMIGCYLMLAGPNGMPLVEDLYLKKTKADYADTYAAITALRFIGTETDVIPRERLLGGLRHMLDRPPLADLVIADLARWEDWSQMERLVKLFKEADEKSSWVRIPIINYLRACPLPKAKEHLGELQKIDPDSVNRANAFFPFGGGGAASGRNGG
jgi:hypothetical protein